MRRNSPAEDYILTLTGVKNLIEQQNKIVEEIKNYEKPAIIAHSFAGKNGISQELIIGSINMI